MKVIGFILIGLLSFSILMCRDSYSPVNKAIMKKEPEYSSFEYSEVILTRPASGTYFFLKNDSLIIIVGGDTVYNAKKNKCLTSE